MNSLAKPWERTRSRIITNPHFWAIAFIMVALIIVYYQDIFFDERLFWIWKLEVFEFNYHMHGILFSIPFIYAALAFWWRGALVAWFLSLAITVPIIFYFHQNTYAIVINLLYLLMPMVIIFYISIELNWRNKERRALAEREAERQDYMSQIFKAQENERHRLARELHDETLQTLLVIATRAEIISSQKNIETIPQASEQAQWIRDTTLSVSEELRRLSLDLRPSILDNLGLIPALRWLVTELTRDNINSHLEIKGSPRTLSPEFDINIFRIVQEALNNIRHHSRARTATVTLEFFPVNIRLIVQDDGIGFFFPKTIGELTGAGKLGLVGMQQRVKFLQGTFSIDSEPEIGTSITIELKA